MGEADCQEGLLSKQLSSYGPLYLDVGLPDRAFGVYGFLVSERFENSTMVFLLSCGD